MRPRFLIFIGILLLLIVSLLFWRRPAKQATTPNITQEITGLTNKGPAMAGVVGQTSSDKLKPISQPPATPKPESDEEKIQRIVREANQPYEQQIEFYGQVIDQDSNPLPNVKIDASVLYEHMFMPTPSGNFPITNNLARLERETGADGRFELDGAKGRNVTIEAIQRDGYEFESGLPKTFGALSGSLDEPVVFKMWSTNIHEQLITGNKHFEIIPDGRAYSINLADGTISESDTGDLKVWIQYTNQVVQGQLYDWSAGIEVINGGLLEVQQGPINSGFWPDPPFAMYSAPKDGYTSSFQFKSQIKGGQSGEIGNRFFYLRLKNGKEYGRMSINLFAPYGRLYPGLVRISYAINPSGSRILR